MSNIKEPIRAEIERRIKRENEILWNAKLRGTTYPPSVDNNLLTLTSLRDFLDTLPDEPEQPTRGYDEAYLNEKIAKASKSWEGVDVDKFMDEIRGREQPVTDCHDLTEAAENSWAVYEYRESPKGLYSTCYVDGFKAGAEWMKTKMMEGTVEGEVCGRCYGHLNIRFADGVYKYLEPKNISHIPADVSKYNIGDNVRIIIVKEEEQ